LGAKGLHQGMSIIGHLIFSLIARMVNHSNTALKKIRSSGRELAECMQERCLSLEKVLNEKDTNILMHHAREGERLFGDHPWTYTRAQKWCMVAMLPLLGVSGPRASVSASSALTMAASACLVAGRFRHLALGCLERGFCGFTAQCILSGSASSFGLFEELF
jgi:hypothetical protein